MLLANFLLQNVARGLYLTLLLATINFFIYARHTEESVFLLWWAGGFLASIVWKFLEAVEIYQKLKELDHGN